MNERMIAGKKRRGKNVKKSNHLRFASRGESDAFVVIDLGEASATNFFCGVVANSSTNIAGIMLKLRERVPQNLLRDSELMAKVSINFEEKLKPRACATPSSLQTHDVKPS